MNHEGELWQEFDDNGEIVKGVGHLPQYFVGGPHCGSSHIWIWRYTPDSSIEILMQERSMEHMSWPGYFDISAAGHINLGENPEDAAIRETEEEIGIDVTSSDLELAFPYKKKIPKTTDVSSKLREFQWIYIYQFKDTDSFDFRDKEVTSLKWVDYDQFKQGIENDTLHAVPHGPEYFGLLYKAIDTKVKD